MRSHVVKATVFSEINCWYRVFTFPQIGIWLLRPHLEPVMCKQHIDGIKACTEKKVHHPANLISSYLPYSCCKKGSGGWIKAVNDDLTWCSVSAGCLCTQCRWGGCWTQKARLPRPPQTSELSESDQMLPSCQILTRQTHTNKNEASKSDVSLHTTWAFNERVCYYGWGQLISPLTMLCLMVTSGQTATQQDIVES